MSNTVDLGTNQITKTGLAQMHPLSPLLPQDGHLNQYEMTSMDRDVVKPVKTSRQRWFGGTKSSLRAFAFLTATVLFFNVGCLVWAKKRYGVSHGVGTLQRGDCATTKRLNFCLHLFINALSTLLLAGSNAFMQAFSSPTRKEIDRAHLKGTWLHIGVVNFRNLWHISWGKVIVCAILALSSTPFHLLYNSLVFQSLSLNQYNWAVVTEGFLTGAPFKLDAGYRKPSEHAIRQFSELQSVVASYDRIENRECLQTYADSFQSRRRHVALVSSENNRNTSILDYGHIGGVSETSNGWLCGRANASWCNTATIDPTDWSIQDHPISYCLSEQVPETCSVRFSFEIMKVLIAFNTIKLVAMLYVLWRFDAEHLLATTGDAVASFLRCEDQTTHHMCMVNKRNLHSIWKGSRSPQSYLTRVRRWSLAVSRVRWLIFIIFMIVCLATVLLLLFLAIFMIQGGMPNRETPSMAVLWEMGFGNLNAQTLLFSEDEQFIKTVLIANIPQVFLAVIWVLYSGIVHSMFLAADWDSFSFRSQPLMVSSPAGKQRGTWLLGLPLRYGLPVAVLHIVTHWIVSQSLFMVQAQLYDGYGELLPDVVVSNCGYSAMSIIFTVFLGVLLLASPVALGFRKFRREGAPVVSTCSAAISAACHPWMVLGEESRYGDFKWAEVGVGWAPHVGHCSLIPSDLFADPPRYAREPVVGRLYA